MFHCLTAATIVLCGCPEAPPAPAAPPAAPIAEPEPDVPAGPNFRVAITIDDLPLAMRDDYVGDEQRRETVTRLVQVLTDRAVPFVGFFNMVHHDADPTLTEIWLTAPAMVVGNHTWSHPNASRTATADYLADLRRGHEAVVGLRPEQTSIPFRFPYLNQGFDPAKREAIFTELDALGSRHAPVTIDTSDWLYARGYLEALHRSDADEADRWRQNWLWNIQESTISAEHMAEDLFGRFPPQVLLLHGNRLAADHLDEALDWYTARGYRFVTLAEALEDPAYEEVDLSNSPIGESHWKRLRRSRELEQPEVVDEASTAAPPVE